MQSSVEDEERELEVIKEVFEKGNIHALDSLPLNLPHKKAKISTSAKIPKKLSKKEIEKREERKKLKEIERIENIQKKLFGERKGKFNELKRPNLLEPIKKKNKNEPMICENKLLKECREMFGTENTKTPKENKQTPKNIVQKHNIDNTNNEVNTSHNSTMRKTFTEKIEIECEQDKQKDKEFIDKLTEEEKDFYQEQTKELFNFLSELNLVRFIEKFILEGYDLFEDFLKLPKDFFKHLDEPFLDKNQQKKLYSKIEEENNKRELEKIEKAQEEEFKKAVNDFRQNKTFTDFDINAKDDTMLESKVEVVCCWNCYKALAKEDAIIKKYSNDDNNIVIQEKVFCSEKCLKEFEMKKHSNIICFECDKIFDMTKGFVVCDGEKFCSVKCKKEYEDKKSKPIAEEEQQQKEPSSSSEEENDSYDPMEDF